MRSKDRGMIQLFVAGMIFYSCCSDPGADICQKIFDHYTRAKHQIEKGNKTLDGHVKNWRYYRSWSSEELKHICSTAMNVISAIFNDSGVMLCTETVHNFMTQHKLLYGGMVLYCDIPNRWRDFHECGKKAAFEKCVIKRMPATLTYLINPWISEEDRMCKEVANLKKCAKEAHLCPKLKDLIYSYKNPALALLSCDQGSDPVAEKCQKIFDRYTGARYWMEKGNKTLKGNVKRWRYHHKWSSEELKNICSTAKNVISAIFTDPGVMLCTQTVHNFMTEHKTLYSNVVMNCEIPNRWRDFQNCGKKGAFEKCVIKAMPATLSYLINPWKRDEDRMCKEAANLKKCVKDADLCQKLKDLIYSYESPSLGFLLCDQGMDPVAEICQKIFDHYSSVQYNLEKRNKILEMFKRNRRNASFWMPSERHIAEICSVEKKMFSQILDSPQVMLCTQRVQNFMRKHDKEYYLETLELCKGRDRWTDLDCGKKWVFEKCLGERMLATLRYLSEPRNSDKCQMCNEAPNLKKCAEKAGLCKNLTDMLYGWHTKEVAALQCQKCKDTNVAAIGVGVAGIVIVVVLLSIEYIRFRRAKRVREFTFREMSTQIPASNTSFTASKRKKIPKHPTNANSTKDTTTAASDERRKSKDINLASNVDAPRK